MRWSNLNELLGEKITRFRYGSSLVMIFHSFLLDHPRHLAISLPPCQEKASTKLTKSPVSMYFSLLWKSHSSREKWLYTCLLSQQIKETKHTKKQRMKGTECMPHLTTNQPSAQVCQDNRRYLTLVMLLKSALSHCSNKQHSPFTFRCGLEGTETRQRADRSLTYRLTLPQDPSTLQLLDLASLLPCSNGHRSS